MSELRVYESLVQGTPEWLAARAGLPTASEFSTLLVKGKGPMGLGVGAVTYAYEVAGEILTGRPAPTFSTPHTEHGHELEPQIRADYEFMRGVSVREIGFMARNRVGYSPDGLVGEDGLLEIKTHLPKKLIGMMLDPGFPGDHIAQANVGLYVSGRDWCDLVAYFDGLPHVIRRLHRDEKAMAEIEDAAGRFNSFVDEIVERIRQAA